MKTTKSLTATSASGRRAVATRMVHSVSILLVFLLVTAFVPLFGSVAFGNDSSDGNASAFNGNAGSLVGTYPSNIQEIQELDDIYTTSPAMLHAWSVVAKDPSFGFTIAATAQQLEFNDVSNSGQTYLDYAFLTVDEEGNAHIIFMCMSRIGRINASSYVAYAGVQGKLLAQTVFGSGNGAYEYSAWQVEISAAMVSTITNGTLSGIFQFVLPSGGHSINSGNVLTFTNFGYKVEHYVYDEDPYDADDVRLYLTTPGAGFPNTPVSAAQITIFGYSYTYIEGLTRDEGVIPEAGMLTLKLYYQSTNDGIWGIKGMNASTMYNGQAQFLDDVLDGSDTFTVILPEAQAGEEYWWTGSVLGGNPSRTDVGLVYQELIVGTDFHIFYEGPHKTTGVEGPEDVTARLGAPLISNGKLSITERPLTITVGNMTLVEGSTIPTSFEISATGFAPGDGPSILGGVAQYQTDYNPLAAAGTTWPVLLSGIVASNYVISFVSGIITVIAPPVTTPDDDPVVPDDDPVVPPVDEPADDPVTPPADDPADEPAAPPVDDPAVDPVVPPVDEPADPIVIPPVDTPAAPPVTPPENESPVVVPPVTDVTENDPPSQIETIVNGEPNPLRGTVSRITDSPISLAGSASWALVNLILAALGMLTAVVMLLAYVIRTQKEEDEEYTDDESQTLRHKRFGWRVLTLIAGMAAVVLFILTENVTLPMVLVDYWTIFHAIIVVLQSAFIVLAVQRKNEEEDRCMA